MPLRACVVWPRPAMEQRQHRDLFGSRQPPMLQRNRVGDHQLVERRLPDSRQRRSRQHRVRRARQHQRRAGRAHRLRRRAERARGVDHVVDDHGRAVVDLADDLHLADDVGPDAPLVDDGEVGIEPLGERAGALHAAGIGRDDRDLAAAEALAQILEQHRRGVDVVDRNVEESLYLAGVEIDREHPRRPGRSDQIGDQLRADRAPAARPFDPAAHSRSTGSRR